MTAWGQVLSISSKTTFSAIALIVAASFGNYPQAHNGEDHSQKKAQQQKALPSSPSEEEILKAINEAYLKQVKPIFQRSCTECHSTNTNLPWYYALPGAKQLMDYDMTESKTHLDMTNDFPFSGHGSPSEDLDAIQEVIEKDEMPPFRYRIMHWSSKVKSEELKAIQDWIQFGKEELKKIKEEEK